VEQLIGITVWRLRDSVLGDEARMLVHDEASGKQVELTPMRVEAERPLAEGERVRIGIESPSTGYLYVIDREEYANGSLGEPMLIFPTTRTRGGDNRVEAGRVIEIPSQQDDQPYFTVRASRKRPNQVGELLTIIVTQKPLELNIGRSPLRLTHAQMLKWETDWESYTERIEQVAGAGKPWTQAEQEAGRNESRQLEQDEALPQTIYRVLTNPGNPLLVTVPLRYERETRPRRASTNLSNGNRTDSSINQPRLIVQTGHSMGAALSVAFSPNGQLLLTGSLDNRALLWNVRTGEEIRSFPGHEISVWSVAFSPDGQKVATGSSSVRVWDVATGKQLLHFATPPTSELGYSVRQVAFSPDGKWIATVINFNVAGSAPVGNVCLWDTATGKMVRCFEGHRAVPRDVAFSPDGHWLLTGSEDSTAILWDINTGTVLRTFQGHTAPVTTVAFAQTGRFVVTGSHDQTTRVWDVTTGRELRQLKGHKGFVYDVAISPDGRFVATKEQELTGIEGDHAMRLWDVATGRILWRLDKAMGDMAFSPDGKHIFVSRVSPTLRDVANGREVQRFEKRAWPVNRFEFARDGKSILMDSGVHASLWDLSSGREETRLKESPGDYGTSAALSPGGRLIAVSSNRSSTIRLLNAVTGQEIGRFQGGTGNAPRLEFSPDGRFLAAADGMNQKTSIWSINTGQKVQSFEGYEFQFSPDGQYILVGRKPYIGMLSLSEATQTQPNSLCMRDIKSGQKIWCFKQDDLIQSFAFSPDARFLVTGGIDGVIRLWDARTGREVRNTAHSSPIWSVTFSPKNGQYILTGDMESNVIMWDTATGKPVRRFVGNSSTPATVNFSPDERLILSGGFDGSSRIWDLVTGEELCRMVSFPDGTWVVVDPDGRFDANNLENIRGLHWVMPDDPFNPLPLEIFMRDYYEPRLLARILAGEKFRAVKDISKLNRMQPGVHISSIEQQQNDPRAVTVIVDVNLASGSSIGPGQFSAPRSGVYDLRLFRDGQLVGYAPQNDGEIKLDETGKAKLTFRNIKLPRIADIKQVEFTAYAFNSDSVKSATDKKVYSLPVASPTIKGRAYLITVGVNAYENSELNLKFAANDARQMQQLLSEKLMRAGTYEEVVQVPLISDYRLEGDRIVVNESTATKQNFKSVLDLLAGRNPNPEFISSIPNATKLRLARPEDLVLISFSSHGYADSEGNFYLVPYDTGPSSGITGELLRRSISSAELSLWLRDVDAGELVLIVDACHSAAAVESKEFKPGPMGSRGLGQLAYDKGMRILTATQADNVALGSGKIEQGLLSYALTHDGIISGEADYRPKDALIMLREWLEYGEGRVPKLYEEIRNGRIRSSAETRILFHETSGKGKTAITQQGDLKLQQPSLFDFTRKKHDLVLAYIGAGNRLTGAYVPPPRTAAKDSAKTAEADLLSVEPPPVSLEQAQIAASLADKNPRDLEAQVKAAKAFYDLAELEKSALYSQRALKIKSKHAGALTLMGNIKYDSKDFVNAASFYERSLSVEPNDADVHIKLGDSYFQMEPLNLEQIAADYRNGLKPNPRIEKAAERALNEYRKALVINPKHETALEYVAAAEVILALLRNNIDAARMAFERLTEAQPLSKTLVFLRIMVDRMNWLNLAKEDPNNFEAQLGAAAIKSQLQRYDEALEFLTRAYKLRPDDLRVMVELGNANFNSARYQEAGQWYSLALSKNPSDIDTRTNYGLTFLLREPPDVERAIAEFRHSLQLNPQHEFALQYISEAFIRKGDAAQAQAALANLEQVNPSNPALPKLRSEFENLRRSSGPLRPKY
jgi:WD40 repeat protein/tetratricopeptide (TPR) repeat protein